MKGHGVGSNFYLMVVESAFFGFTNFFEGTEFIEEMNERLKSFSLHIMYKIYFLRHSKKLLFDFDLDLVFNFESLISASLQPIHCIICNILMV